MTDLRARLAAWSLVPLRLAIGVGFIEHGYAKLARGPEHFAAILAAIGLPGAHALAWATTLVELLGGIALVVGAFVVPACVVLACVMMTALLTVHLPLGFSSVRLIEITAAGPRFGPVGYELPLVYLVSLAALAMAPASPWSIDRRRARSY